MPGELGSSSYYQYVSDDGTTYKIRMRDQLAVATGQVASDGTHPDYGRGRKARHVWAKIVESGAVRRKKFIIGTLPDTEWQPGGNITVAGTGGGTFLITGKIGERRH